MLFKSPKSINPAFGPRGGHLNTSMESFGTPAPSRTLLDFEFLKLLGKGNSGIVFLARDKRALSLVALKVIPKLAQGVQFENIAAEQHVQLSLSDHSTKQFLPLLCSWHDQKNFYLVTEYLAGGDMALELMRCRKFEENRAKFYASELILAIEELRERKIIHRDIKPANILFTADGHLCIADFGLSKGFAVSPKQDTGTMYDWLSFDVDGSCDSGSFLKAQPDADYTTNEKCGTAFYMSPEQHKGESYSFEADQWAVGALLYRMLAQRMPFGGDTTGRDNIGFCVINDPLAFKATDEISSVAKDLLHRMLAKDPRARISLDEIKAHAFFDGIDWAKIKKQELKAPWKPYIPPAPKQPMAERPVTKGLSYEGQVDPFPLFQFTSPRMDHSQEVKVLQYKKQDKAFNALARMLGDLFQQQRKKPELPLPQRSNSAPPGVMNEATLRPPTAGTFTLPQPDRKAFPVTQSCLPPLSETVSKAKLQLQTTGAFAPPQPDREALPSRPHTTCSHPAPPYPSIATSEVVPRLHTASAFAPLQPDTKAFPPYLYTPSSRPLPPFRVNIEARLQLHAADAFAPPQPDKKGFSCLHTPPSRPLPPPRAEIIEARIQFHTTGAFASSKPDNNDAPPRPHVTSGCPPRAITEVNRPLPLLSANTEAKLQLHTAGAFAQPQPDKKGFSPFPFTAVKPELHIVGAFAPSQPNKKGPPSNPYATPIRPFLPRAANKATDVSSVNIAQVFPPFSDRNLSSSPAYAISGPLPPNGMTEEEFQRHIAAAFTLPQPEKAVKSLRTFLLPDLVASQLPSPSPPMSPAGPYYSSSPPPMYEPQLFTHSSVSLQQEPSDPVISDAHLDDLPTRSRCRIIPAKLTTPDYGACSGKFVTLSPGPHYSAPPCRPIEHGFLVRTKYQFLHAFSRVCSWFASCCCSGPGTSAGQMGYNY